MLAWALFFVFAALASGAVGWGEVSAPTGLVGRILFFVFLLLFAVSLTNGIGTNGFGVYAP